MTDKYGYNPVDTSDPRVRRLMTSHLGTMLRQAHTLDKLNGHQFFQSGMDWYPKVKAATEKGVEKHFGSMDYELSGPGAVAAVSPNMDWERDNIHAISELAGLKQRDWDTIVRSQGTPGKRTPEAKDVLKGLSISKAPDHNLVKAYRILRVGEDPEEVIQRQGAPKTFSFMHNINGSPQHVTIDGRAHDMAANQMRSWSQDRGLKTPDRYNSFENIYRNLSKHLNASDMAVHDVRTGRQIEVQPHHVQAILWEYGKHLERQMNPTAAGTPGDRGPTRVGQRYLGGRHGQAAPRVTPPPEAMEEGGQSVAGSPEPTSLPDQRSVPEQVLAMGRSQGARRRGRGRPR